MSTFYPRHIELTEEPADEEPIAHEGDRVLWTAMFDGPLATGEHVVMARSAPTAREAKECLITAMREQGWEENK